MKKITIAFILFLLLVGGISWHFMPKTEVKGISIQITPTPTITVAPTQSPSSTEVVSTPVPTIATIDCIGVDGKHMQITQKLCDEFNAAWSKHANNHSDSHPSSTNTNTGVSTNTSSQISTPVSSSSIDIAPTDVPATPEQASPVCEPAPVCYTHSVCQGSCCTYTKCAPLTNQLP